MGAGTFYNENKVNRIRRIKLAAVVFVTFLLQSNQYIFPRITDAPFMLLVPLTVSIGMFEKERWGMFFGLFAGVLMDAFSAESLCYHSIALTCIGFFSGLLITGIFRNCIKTFFLISGVSLFIYNTVYFLIFYFAKSGGSSGYIYANIYFASVIYTLFLAVILYLIVRAIFVNNKPE